MAAYAMLEAMNHLLEVPAEGIGKSAYFPAHRGGDTGEGCIAVDILDAPHGFVFYVDMPGCSKSDVQVAIEDENTLLIKRNGKRKRNRDAEEDDCKYLRLERKSPHKMMARKFRLPDGADPSAITAKCENGVLTVTVGKRLPFTSKKVEVHIS